MIFDCVFDPIKDVREVDQFGYVDLREVLETGVVPSESAVEDTEYTDIDDPESLKGRPRTNFDMVDAGNNILRQAEGVQQIKSPEGE
jgi:hypothetical protein